MTVADADGGTHTYGIKARSLRDARRYAREWMVGVEWCTGIVSVRPEFEGSARRLLVIAGVTFAVATPAVAAAMVIGLRLEGAM